MVVVCACRLLVVNVAVDVLSVELVVTNDVVGLILVSSFSVNANADDVVVTLVVKLDIRATRMEKEKKYYTMISDVLALRHKKKFLTFCYYCSRQRGCIGSRGRCNGCQC